MTAMAMVVQARPHRLRRADHRARRHHPDRGAGGDQGRDPRGGHGRPLHHPRPRAWSPRSPTGSWCCATARWSSTARPGRSCTEPREDYTRALVNVRRVGRRTKPPDQADAGARGRAASARPMAEHFLVLEDVIAAARARAPRSRWSANRARGKSTLARVDHRPAAAARGRDLLAGRAAARARSRTRSKDQLRRAPDDLPDAGRGAEPAPDGRRDHRPAARRSTSASAGRERRRPGRRAARPDRAAARASPAATRPSSRAARSSASASPARSPPSPS